MEQGITLKKMNEPEVMELISKSKGFYNTFLRANDNIKKLFIQLACESSIFSCNDNGYVKEMVETGYRLAKRYIRGRRIQNYCMFTISSEQKVIIDVRTDGLEIKSEIINLMNRGNCFSGGFEWYRFSIKSESELVEALKLIELCYKN
ncbi:hypothetical protein [Clostridium sp. YIM B02500]|uniref:hypothetical protein n=1 Tax=Clostridium sp. YIM B02500 TaxID=2910681 RepID=UPI001EED7502|nr:hypothetical protein [Clostridium sp. YIM B02500]